MSPYWKITGGLDFHKWVLKIGALGVSKQCAIQVSPAHGHCTVTSRTVPMLPEVLSGCADQASAYIFAAHAEKTTVTVRGSGALQISKSMQESCVGLEDTCFRK